MDKDLQKKIILKEIQRENPAESKVTELSVNTTIELYKEEVMKIDSNEVRKVD